MSSVDKPSQSVLTFLDSLDTIPLPSSIECYRQPIIDEIRWCIHTCHLGGSRRRSNTQVARFYMMGIQRFIEYYSKLHLIKYQNTYDFCAFYGLNRQNNYNNVSKLARNIKNYRKKLDW